MQITRQTIHPKMMSPAKQIPIFQVSSSQSLPVCLHSAQPLHLIWSKWSCHSCKCNSQSVSWQLLRRKWCQCRNTKVGTALALRGAHSFTTTESKLPFFQVPATSTMMCQRGGKNARSSSGLPQPRTIQPGAAESSTVTCRGDGAQTRNTSRHFLLLNVSRPAPARAHLASPAAELPSP